MSWHVQLDTLLVQVLTYLGLLTPVAYAAIRAWLLASTNKGRLDSLPSNGDLDSKINAIVQAQLQTNGKEQTPNKGE